MQLLLEKDNSQKKVFVGKSYLLLIGLIPLIGEIIFLILTISKKQFKGVFLTSYALKIIIAIIFTAIQLSVMMITNESISLTFIYVMLAIGLVADVVKIILIIYYCFNANYLSLNQYLDDGYIICENNQETKKTKQFIAKSKEIKKPWFQYISF